MPMRILVCTNVYPPRFVGGAELVAHEVARNMALLGHTVAVFAGDLNGPGAHHGVTVDELDGLTVYRLTTLPADYDADNCNYIHPDIDAQFAAILREFQPTIVHAHNLIGLSVRMLITAAESGARVFTTLHDFWGFCLRHTLLRKDGSPCGDHSGCAACLNSQTDVRAALHLRNDVMRLAFDHVEGLIAPSRHVADAYLAAGFASDRLTVLPNGIDLAPYRHAENAGSRPGGEAVVLLYAGYFGAHKGLLVLLQAMAMMDHREAVVLDLVGDGPLDAGLRAFARQQGLADRVRFRGKVDPAAMATVYAASDVFVLPSVWPENQPVCLMEAMASAKPVIASRIGGIPEMLEDGREGLLVQPDDATALAQALDRLACDRDLRTRMGQAGRQKVAGYGYREQAQAMLALFAGPVQPQWRAQPSRPIIALRGGHLPGRRALDDNPGYVIPLAWLSPLQLQRASTPLRLGTGAWLAMRKLARRARAWITP